jgi:hypothetical protein
LGIRKTYLRLEARLYWFGMARDVAKYVKCCLECQQSKNRSIPVAPATSFKPESPWELVSIDLMGPYPKGHFQNQYLLVIVDMFSKYVEMFPLRQATSEKVIEKLWEVFCRWGVPKVLVSDNGSQFISKVYENFCECLGVKAFHIAVYHAQANTTERYNETIKEMIVTAITKCKDWDRYIPELSFALRTSVSDATSFTPAYLNHGRELRTPFDNLVSTDLSSVRPVRDIAERMVFVYNIARDHILKSQNSYLSQYNQRAKMREFTVGDFVWYKKHSLADASKGYTPKLAPKRELCQIVEKVSSTVFDLERVEDLQKITKVHVNDLLPFFSSEKVEAKEL